MMVKRIFTPILALALTLCACSDDMDYSANVEGTDVLIEDGKPQSPAWLVNAMESVANQYNSPEGKEPFYPDVFLLTYEGRNYIALSDFLSSYSYDQCILYTMDGEEIPPFVNDIENDLYNQIRLDAESTCIFSVWREGGKDELPILSE